jgi:hypothetical protein
MTIEYLQSANRNLHPNILAILRRVVRLNHNIDLSSERGARCSVHDAIVAEFRDTKLQLVRNDHLMNYSENLCNEFHKCGTAVEVKGTMTNRSIEI